MHHLLRKAWFVAGFGFVVVGCSGKSSDGGVSAAPVSAQDFPAQLAQVYCAQIGSCCNAANIAFDATTCKTSLENVGAAVVATQAGQVYDAAAAGKCLAEFKQLLETCQPQAADSGNAADCDSIVVGTAPAGAACDGSGGCAPPNRCVYAPTGVTGTCGPAPQPAALGAACTDRNCAADGYCNAGVCTATHDSGPCSAYDECTAKAYCAAGQCVPRQQDGAACIDDSECAAGKCQSSNGGPGTCGPSMLATELSCAGKFD